jgi:hypothetical protein
MGGPPLALRAPLAGGQVLWLNVLQIGAMPSSHCAQHAAAKARKSRVCSGL